jgi:hypothetical protein
MSETSPHWIKAECSIGTGNCVEAAAVDDGVLLRDSKDPDGPWLRYTTDGFKDFLVAAKNGDFDHLA